MKGVLVIFSILLIFGILPVYTENVINCPNTGTTSLPYPTSCSKFVFCAEGEMHIFPCPDGYYFNPSSEFCDIPVAKGCHLDDKAGSEENAEDDGNDIPEDESSAEDSGDAEDTMPEGDSSVENGSQGDSGDVEDNEDTMPEGDLSVEDGSQGDSGLLECPTQGIHYFPHPSSCSRFIKCNQGLYRVVDCIEGYYFNSKLGWCELASNVNCTIAEEDRDLDLECPSSGRYFLAHPRSCSKFVKCNEGSYRIINCAEGQHFNPTFGWCDIPSKVDCTIDDEKQNDEDLELTFECSGSAQAFYPHPRSCSQFIECNFGQHRVHECILGLHFNSNAGHCDFPSNANCKL